MAARWRLLGEGEGGEEGGCEEDDSSGGENRQEMLVNDSSSSDRDMVYRVQSTLSNAKQQLERTFNTPCPAGVTVQYATMWSTGVMFACISRLAQTNFSTIIEKEKSAAIATPPSPIAPSLPPIASPSPFIASIS